MRWGNEVCSNGSGHMANMVVMPMYGKNLKNQKADNLETWYAALGA